MKDRLISVLPQRLGLLLVAVLVVGSFWLAAAGTHGPSVNRTSPDAAASAASQIVLAAFPLEPKGPGKLPEAVALESPMPGLFPPRADQLLHDLVPYGQEALEPVSGPHSLAPSETFLPAPFALAPSEATEEEFLRRLREAFGLSEPPDEPPAGLEADLSFPSAPEEAAPELADSSEAGPGAVERSGQPSGPENASQPEATEQAPGLLQPPPPAWAGRSRGLELIAREADVHTRRGFALAGKRAYFSARAELVMALRLVAQALDAEHQTGTHSRALAAGWTAIKEADDFIPTGSRFEADLDLSSIIGGHRTPVLKDAPVESLVPLAALQSYFTFAQEQLAAAAGEEMAGSMALHALGNLHRALAAERSPSVRAATPKAMVFYQAALLVTPQNYIASNELGVLLARGGRCEDARTALEHSVSVCPQPVGWYNLAVVYRRLGRTDLAQRAYRQCQAVYQAQTARHEKRPQTSGRQVEWVDPDTFARLYAEPSAVESPTHLGGLSRDWPKNKLGTVSRFAPRKWGCPVPECGEDAVGAACEAVHALAIGSGTTHEPEHIRLCQALGPAAPCNVCAVDCSTCDGCPRGGWERARAIAWQAYAQGEYVGHERTAHVPEYRLRVDDLLDLVYRVTRDETSAPYRLNVGDEVRVESFTDKELDRDLIIQPDGTITLRLLGQVRATGRTVVQLREGLDKLYAKYYPVPAITVTPLKVNTKLEDLRSVVDSRYGPGGQSRSAKITPEGTISLPVIGSVRAQGLTLGELQQELNECYREEIEGMEIIPVLVQRAPRFVYVLGEVRNPGRFELTGPTTALQALSMAGSWNVGANLRQIVIFRRGDDWRLMATMIDLAAALHGKQACPAGEIWLADSDVVIVPKSHILRTDDFIDLVFTRGLYGVFPVQAAVNFSKLSTL